MKMLLKFKLGLGDAFISEIIDVSNSFFSELLHFIDLTLLRNLIEHSFLCNLQLACFCGGYGEDDF